MRHAMTAACGTLAIVTAVGLQAQSPVQSPAVAKTVTFAGCLERSVPSRMPPSSMPAAPGSKMPEGTPAGISYKLDTSRHVDRAMAKGDKAEYEVRADAPLDLATHVGHTVEVTGALKEESPQEKAGGNDLRIVIASSVKMISSTCGL